MLNVHPTFDAGILVKKLLVKTWVISVTLTAEKMQQFYSLAVSQYGFVIARFSQNCVCVCVHYQPHTRKPKPDALVCSALCVRVCVHFSFYTATCYVLTFTAAVLSCTCTAVYGKREYRVGKYEQ